jgi:chorismate mutase/prephenate dehydratase
VAETKQATGGSFYAPDRERAIIDRLQAKNSGPFPDHALRPVFQEVISACLSLEATVTVAYLGPEATFTHQAVKRHFGTSARTVPCGSIPAVFADVAKGSVDFGVVPVENSTEGVVSHTLDSFVDGTLSIAAEIIVDVDHCLMARPEVATSAIKRVYSHPQALAQCRQWLDANLKSAVRVESPSTAAAAQSAAGDTEGAAIAAELASRMYGLKILRNKLQDVAENATRFLVVGRDGAPPPLAGSAETGGFKTSLLLSLPDRAGALFHILQPITEAGINLTKIESRPTRQKAWDYVFFLDLDGHIDDPPVAGVLESLAEICDLCKVLGCYRKADVVGAETSP